MLEQLVTPPSASHIPLLKYILNIALMLFIPYLCMLMGASISSLLFGYMAKTKRPGQKAEANAFYLKFSRDIIERLTITKNAEFALGIIPVLSILFSYAQLMYAARTITIGMMALSVIIFIAAFVLIYRYRTSFRIENVLNAYKSVASPTKERLHKKTEEEIREFEENLLKTKHTSGLTGTILLFLAAYIFTGSMQLTLDPYRWQQINNILALLFSWTTFSNFLTLLAASGLMTGGAILFYFFRWQGGMEIVEEQLDYAKFVKKFAVTLSFASGIILPLLLFYNFIYLPQVALSPSVFSFMVLTLTAILLLGGFLYYEVKYQETRFAVPVFLLTLLVLFLNIIKDQTAFGNAMAEQTQMIIQKAEELENEKKGKIVLAGGLSGEEIYKQKCASCHKFDTRLVGPPHNQVVPKYGGNVQKLADFILSPAKVDAGYPPMPAPGLKPKEAQAVAKYLIEMVGKK
jgi:cytochrome c